MSFFTLFSYLPCIPQYSRICKNCNLGKLHCQQLKTFEQNCLWFIFIVIIIFSHFCICIWQRVWNIISNIIQISLYRFRWDHIKRFTNIRKGKRFPGFEQFLAGGVQTEYLTSVFPSESFPAWQTINTGTVLILFYKCVKNSN